MTELEAVAILARANAAVTWAAAGNSEQTAAQWAKLVALVGNLTNKSQGGTHD